MVVCCQVVCKLEIVATWAVVLLIGLFYGQDGCQMKAAWAGGVLARVRVYNGILIRKEPLGKPPLGSERLPEIVISSRHLFTSLTLRQLSKFPDVCTPRGRGKVVREAVFYQWWLSFCFFLIAACVFFPRVRYICLYETAFS